MAAKPRAQAPPRPPGAVRRWLRGHRQAIAQTLRHVRAAPLGTLLTAAVVGLTLALPAALHVLVRNAGEVSSAWQGAVQVSFYLEDAVSAAEGAALAATLKADAQVNDTRYISREAALAEFRAHSGFANALDLLDENPLPAVIVLTPEDDLSREAITAVMQRHAARPEVAFAKLDQQWLERLHALLRLVNRAITLVALGIGIAVIIIIGNTLRLEIERRRDEIVVMKLIGASARFIQRPFLYTGVLLGLMGGVLAWTLVQALVLALTGPAAYFASLYGSDYALAGLGWDASLGVLAGGLMLGTAGALWTVKRHLAGVEPRFSGPGS
ncbi:MAG: cell division protein FtsX [Polycyclovorans sp.]|jgi:cell division transport system permease protein|nr:cell division protein FtsX [Polycyclovorans sp.]MBU0790583.1 permease-like cell division protein FtsX [Gammaproteobacteria bacterium]|tara:strand:+ start:142 stop:1119 length:978 start_codon:yes stop_codon:yes gene_type:complete